MSCSYSRSLFFRLPSLAHDVVRPGHRYLKDEVFFVVGYLLQAHGRGRRTGHKVNYLFFKLFYLFSIPHHLLVIIINLYFFVDYAATLAAFFFCL